MSESPSPPCDVMSPDVVTHDSDVKQLLSRAISITFIPSLQLPQSKSRTTQIIYLARTKLHDSSHLLLIHLAVNLTESQLL